jgi:hypothetical protein
MVTLQWGLGLTSKLLFILQKYSRFLSYNVYIYSKNSSQQWSSDPTLSDLTSCTSWGKTVLIVSTCCPPCDGKRTTFGVAR